MAAPNPFQKLKHGVLLCKANFMTFVETFNFLVDFAQNIRGDGDAGRNGTITVDRTNPDTPIIRSKVDPEIIDWLVKSVKDNGRFAIVKREGTASGVFTFTNCYYRIGGKTYTMPDTDRAVSNGDIVALSIYLNSTSPVPAIVNFTSMADLSAAERDESHYIVPLYKIGSNGGIDCDFRIGPDAAAWEFSS